MNIISSSVKMPLEFLFGRRKTPEEILKQNQRALNKVRYSDVR